jgi:hypothetical protein
MAKICDYGCGKPATHQFKNGKWCCSKYLAQCPTMKKKNGDGNRGRERKNNLFKSISDKYPWFSKYEEFKPNDENLTEIKVRCKNKNCKNSKDNNGWFIPNKSQISERMRCLKTGHGNCYLYCSDECKKEYFESGYGDKINKKRYKFEKGKNNPMFGKPSPNRYTINFLKNKYDVFSKIEEMRYNPNKPGEKEIQVHCKNHNCPNSKEKGGWFTPNNREIAERLRSVEFCGIDNSYFYCSDECKQTCILYGLRSDPFKDNEKVYTEQEYNVWKQQVLKQDNYECQKCGSKENLHCHHINPIKTHPYIALDPENGIVLCQECHYEIGHKDKCSTGNLANKQINCKLGR